MIRRTLTALAVLALAVPAAAFANPTAAHRKQYLRAYRAVVRQDGPRAPGRNIIRDGTSAGRAPTDQQVVRSIRILTRMLTPVVIDPPAPPPTAPAVVYTAPAATTQTAGLVACIIAHESGGNPQAINGQYAGIGQWSPSAWAQDGGTRYASSPLSASYTQQLNVLLSEGPTGMQDQQARYDGCP